MSQFIVLFSSYRKGSFQQFSSYIFSRATNNMVLPHISDFNGVVLVQNYLERAGRQEWARQVSVEPIFDLSLEK